MAKITGNRREVIYDSYEEYVKIQDGRSHTYDCPNCLKINKENMRELLKISKDIRSIVDVGSRDSAYFDKYPDIYFLGIDISPTSVNYAISQGRNVILCDVNELSKKVDTKFDAIISSHSLEHFLDPLKSLQECYKVLNPKGILFVRIPGENKIKDVKKAHVRTFNRQELSDIIKEAGFIIVKNTKIGDNLITIGIKK